MRCAYFKLLGNHQLVDPIFNDVIKVAMENAAFWENMQTLEQSTSTIEENNKSFVSAASKFNNNFTYQYPAQRHAEIPVEIPDGHSYVEYHVECSTVCHYHHHSRNQREPNNNNEYP